MILERLAEPHLAGAAQSRDGGVEVELLSQHVLAEPAQVPGLERQHRPVPEHALERLAPEHEPRQAASLLPTRLDPPATGHAQVAAHDDPALEAEQQVLADRLDRLEHASVDAGSDLRRLGARVRRLDLEPLADERPQPHRRTMERVALGHDVQLRASVFDAWHSPCPHRACAAKSMRGPAPAPTYDAAARTLFDRTTRLAASLLDVPIALITIADDDRPPLRELRRPEAPMGRDTGDPALALRLPARNQDSNSRC